MVKLRRIYYFEALPFFFALRGLNYGRATKEWFLRSSTIFFYRRTIAEPLFKFSEGEGEKGMARYNKLMDIDELADYLRLKRQTIYNWLHQNKISGIKIGGVWRFDKRDIDKWLKSKQRHGDENA